MVSSNILTRCIYSASIVSLLYTSFVKRICASDVMSVDEIKSTLDGINSEIPAKTQIFKECQDVLLDPSKSNHVLSVLGESIASELPSVYSDDFTIYLRNASEETRDHVKTGVGSVSSNSEKIKLWIEDSNKSIAIAEENIMKLKYVEKENPLSDDEFNTWTSAIKKTRFDVSELEEKISVVIQLAKDVQEKVEKSYVPDESSESACVQKYVGSYKDAALVVKSISALLIMWLGLFLTKSK